MGDFYIKKVIARGDPAGDSLVEFGPGLNIIQGPSDSGKTCIAKCIAFVFGEKFKGLFPKKSKCNEVIVIVSTSKGDITLDRKVGKNQIEVSSGVDIIASGKYNVDYRKNSGGLFLNDLWLKLIGIDSVPEVPWNKEFQKKRLTWKNLLRMFYIDEDRIGQSDSVILPESPVEQTLFLSCLLYLLTGKDFSEQDASEKNTIRKAKRNALQEYFNKRISEAPDKKAQLTAEVASFDGDNNIEGTMETIISEIEDVDRQITDAMNRSRDLLSQIMDAQNDLAECDVLLSRYSNLRSQYKADIQRLTFVVNGEKERKKLPANTVCPFCESKIKPAAQKSYVQASQGELDRILSQINGLEETEAEVQNERKDIQERLDGLRLQQEDIRKLIDDELQPLSESLSKTLGNYQGYLAASQKLEIFEEYVQEWSDELDRLAKEEKEPEKLEYHPREYFTDEFLSLMNDYAEAILKECKYPNLTVAKFSLQDFDIYINGAPKTDHGKGYRAVINTVVVMMFRQYLIEHACFNPGFHIIDTPLHGFDEGVDESVPESVRTALYQYFLDHQNGGQMIVIENLDHIPHLDYEKSGATVITFTKGKSAGRFGFLNDLTE